MANVQITDIGTENTNPTQSNTYIEIEESDGTSSHAKIRAILGTGWAYYDDATYTSGSPLNSNNAKTQILIDGAGGDTVTSQLPSGVTALWDTTNDKILAPAAGDAFEVRLDFVCEPATVNDFAEIVFDIGSGSPIEIGRDTITFAKTGATRFFRSYTLFAGSTFAANGCKVYFDTSVSGDSINIYNLGIVVKRDYKA